MSEVIARFVGLALTLFIGIFALGGVKLYSEKRRLDLEEQKAQADAAAAKEETIERIQKTDARDLVAADPDPAARGTERDAIANGFRQRIRDRSREVISRHDGS